MATVLLLLAQGATLNTEAPPTWGSPLHQAIINGRYEVVQTLLDHIIKSNSTWMGTHDYKLMRLAIMNGPRRVVLWSPRWRADPNFSTYPADSRRDRSGSTELLLDRGARCNVWDADVPLLNLAVQARNQKVVRLLIDAGAHVNMKSKHGVAPLFMALSAGDEEITKLLLDNGARTDLRNNSGLTPLLYIAAATRSGGRNILSSDSKSDRPPEMVASVDDETHASLVHLLLNHGADVNCEDPDGGTPLWWAIQRKHFGAVKLLRKMSGYARPRTADAENASNTAIDERDYPGSEYQEYEEDLLDPESPPDYHSDSYVDFIERRPH